MRRKRNKNRKNEAQYEAEFDGMNDDTELVRVDDSFLPSPGEIARSLRKSKITIMLDDHVIAYFKAEGKKHQMAYQKFIRELLRHYVRSRKRAA